MSETQVLIPGDLVGSSLLPNAAKRKIGRGLYQLPSSDSHIATIAGPLSVDYRKKTAHIATPNARYVPRAGDLVIAQVRSSGAEMFQLYINSHSPQTFLPQLAFEGATKKTRPQLKSGDLVYAKVVFTGYNMETELSCVNPSTGKAEPDGLGPLSGGMVFDVSLGMSERLTKKECMTWLEELGGKLQGGFEICVGRNGRIWVDCPEQGVKGVVAVGRCLREVDEGLLTEKEAKKAVNRICHELGIS